MSPRTRTLILSQRTLNFKLNNELRQLNEPRNVLFGIILAAREIDLVNFVKFRGQNVATRMQKL